ncbi:oligoribonuclease [Schaalia cardiffensis F0333]|uniref:Oligoribonuclease n=3 Tax=Schaalia TaxID=2529408 RepID=N6W5C5_9ACTO|nr:oligoribonuclease [Schaalia cardiffensis F0333]
MASSPNQVARSAREHARLKLVGMTAQLKDPLVWIDCEMTGLDVHKDALVEVGVVITDADLKIVDKGIDVLIKPPAAALENMNDFVRNMHTTSGLLDELEGGLSLEEATGQVLDYIRRFVPEQGKALLAGNSVGTDKMFLEAYMPSVIDHLHYRIVDVSSVKELAKRWHRRAFENAPVKHGGHRALADILESIQELEYYRRVLFPAEPVTRAQAKAALKDALALKIPAIGEDE